MELLTDKQILKKALHMGCVANRFEFGVIEYLKREKTGDLYILADFYDICCELLNLTHQTGEYYKNKRKIQYRFKKMKNKGLIDWRKSGVGFMGKTDFGMTSLNCYTLPRFWF